MRYQAMKLPSHPASLWADALALALAVSLPLFMPNGYVALIGEKFGLLLACTLVGTAAVLVSLLAVRTRRGMNPASPAWLWPVGLCASYTVAWRMADDRYTAFWGLSGRKNGLLMLLVCTLVYLLVSAFATADGTELLLGALTATGVVVTGISWLNYWMLDPLDAYYTFLPGVGELFLGTMGNINFYGALLCLCVPLAAAAYLRKGGGRWHWRYVVVLVLCSGLIPAGSDGAWLGTAAAVGVLCCTRRTTARTLSRLFSLGAGVLACGVLTGLLARVWPVRNALRTISAVLASPLMLLPMVLCLLAARGLARLGDRPAVRPARVAAGVIVLAGLGAVLAANLLPACPGFLSALHFDERWGANRGYAWQRLWVIYTQDLSLPQMLFGLGGDAVSARLAPDIESIRYMILLNGETFDSAHNEFLQHLVCGGVVGLACWCGFLAAAVRRGLRARPAVAAALVGYAVQSFFSISMPGALPLVFVLAGVAVLDRGHPWHGAGWRAGAACVLFLAALVCKPYLPVS